MNNIYLSIIIVGLELVSKHTEGEAGREPAQHMEPRSEAREPNMSSPLRTFLTDSDEDNTIAILQGYLRREKIVLSVRFG